MFLLLIRIKLYVLWIIYKPISKPSAIPIFYDTYTHRIVLSQYTAKLMTEKDWHDAFYADRDAQDQPSRS